MHRKEEEIYYVSRQLEKASLYQKLFLIKDVVKTLANTFLTIDWIQGLARLSLIQRLIRAAAVMLFRVRMLAIIVKGLIITKHLFS